MKKNLTWRLLILVTLIFFSCHFSFSQKNSSESVLRQVDTDVAEFMKKGDIPGLSLVIIDNGRTIVKSYGYSDLDKKSLVTPTTLFELGSCSKAFTALALIQMVDQGKVKLDNPVTEYIPWLRTSYRGNDAKITIRQLLYHTSGIPWNTISKIPQTTDPDALEKTVKQLKGQELAEVPGKKYEYATLNYVVLALVIERVTGQKFETYLKQRVFDTLQLRHTSIGSPSNPAKMATGYKIGFFAPRRYQAPPFQGNNAAGYVISNAEDVSRWLKLQMGLVKSELYGLAEQTHMRDETVPLHNMQAYAMGWEVSLSGNREIHHGGVNPNYTSYILFRKHQKIGVAVLANSNSSFTPTIANRIIKLLTREEINKEYHAGDRNDKTFSIVTFLMSAYILVTAAFLLMVLADTMAGRRKSERVTTTKLWKFLLSLSSVVPFLLGLYMLPQAMYGFTWESILVWTPISMPVAVILILASLTISYFTSVVSLVFPERDKFKRLAPKLLLFSILSGLFNMIVIMLITSSLDSKVELKYLVFYYVLTLSVYLLGRQYVQIHIIKLSRELTYKLREKLIGRILSTTFQRFEKLDRGRVYTAVNDDVDTIGQSANVIVMMTANFITSISAILYLASIALWATALTFALILLLVMLYYLVSKRTNKYFEEARDTRSGFMGLVNGMIDGYKEISMNRRKKLHYEGDMIASANKYRMKITTASIRFVNASLVGESLLILLLGAIVFAFPKLFPEVENYTLMSFVVVLLYLIGPVSAIMGSVPTVMNLRIAWNRVQQFLKEIPLSNDLRGSLPFSVPSTITKMKAQGVEFAYESSDQQHSFHIGPIDLEAEKGEIIFIIGGNGSGKTTLAKLLTGLYEPKQGRFEIDGESIDPVWLGEYFSTVFSPAHLFEKLYDVDTTGRMEEVEKYLKLLDLERKVKITDNRYSTINLSGGQRKRLALLQCYLEDSPIYLFDEWAADQDPEYRCFFYRTLLPQISQRGKIVIAITHDDHYFDVANRVFRMNQGSLETYNPQYTRPTVA